MDAAVVVRAQRGDERAFSGLALAIGDRLHAVAYRVLRDRALAEDATQQALLQIWRDLPQLRDPTRFEAWSYRVLVRTCHAEARRARGRARNVYLLRPDDAVIPDGSGSIADRDQLDRAFRRLSVDHRMVVVLHHYLGQTVEEIADALALPAGTVRSRLYHAMRGLRAALEADARPGPREVVS